MKCSNCGAEFPLRLDREVCPDCGEVLSEVAPNEPAEINEEPKEEVKVESVEE